MIQNIIAKYLGWTNARPESRADSPLLAGSYADAHGSYAGSRANLAAAAHSIGFVFDSAWCCRTHSVFGMLSLDCVNQLTFLETKLGTLLLPTLVLLALFAWHHRTRRRIEQGEDGLVATRTMIEACHWPTWLFSMTPHTITACLASSRSQTFVCRSSPADPLPLHPQTIASTFLFLVFIDVSNCAFTMLKCEELADGEPVA